MQLNLQFDTQRKLLLAGFLGSIFLMATALMYFQYYLQLEPCPLCIMQRVVVISLGLVFLVAAIHNPAAIGRKIYAIVLAIIASIGLAISVRHVWIQNLPADQVPECGPGLDYMLEVFPLMKALTMVFQGSGECAEVLWQFLGLTIPGWMLVVFSGYFIAAILLFINLKFWRANSNN